MSHLDLELEIQRCIDGQMSEADQQALLRRLEALPGGWRKLSLAFVENQVWSQSIQKGEMAVAKSPVPEPRPSRRVPFGLWGKVAASMAAGIMAAVVIHQQWSGGPPLGAGSSLATATSSEKAEPKSGASGSAQSPVSANTAASLASNGPGSPEVLSPQARRQLRESGYAIDDNQMYYAIRMPDGRYYVVPVERARLRNGVE